MLIFELMADTEGRADEVEEIKQAQLKKQKEGKGEWEEGLASDSESIVRSIHTKRISFGGSVHEPAWLITLIAPRRKTPRRRSRSYKKRQRKLLERSYNF